MRQGFWDVIRGWSLVAGREDLAALIRRAEEWAECNGPLEPGERKALDIIVHCQAIRGADERPIALWVTPRGDWIGPRKEG